MGSTAIESGWRKSLRKRKKDKQSAKKPQKIKKMAKYLYERLQNVSKDSIDYSQVEKIMRGLNSEIEDSKSESEEEESENAVQSQENVIEHKLNEENKDFFHMKGNPEAFAEGTDWLVVFCQVRRPMVFVIQLADNHITNFHN